MKYIQLPSPPLCAVRSWRGGNAAHLLPRAPLPACNTLQPYGVRMLYLRCEICTEVKVCVDVSLVLEL